MKKKAHLSSLPNMRTITPDPSYPNPSLHSSQSEQSSRKKKRHRGSPKRVHKLIQSFVQRTTLHGVNHLGPSCKGKQKILWILAVLVCGVMLIGHASMLIYNAWKRPPWSTTLTLKYRSIDNIDGDDMPKFPGITICRLNPIKDEEHSGSLTFATYMSLSLGYPYNGLTLEEKSLLFDVIHEENDKDEDVSQYKAMLLAQQARYETEVAGKDFNMTDYLMRNSASCEDVFVRCIHGLQSFNCCKLFSPVLTTLGTCHNMDLGKLDNTKVTQTLPFIFDLKEPLSKVRESEEGYLVSVHDPRFVPRLILPKDGFLVSAEFVVDLRLVMKMTDYTAQHTEFFGLITKCPNWTNPNSEVAYSFENCIFQKAVDRIRERCKCTWILGIRENYRQKDKLCGPKEMTECLVKNVEWIFGEVMNCRMPCLDYRYDASASYARLSNSNSEERKSRISISYSGDSYYHNLYHRFYLSSLFSEIGGSMGLLLGASAITGLELLTFLLQFIYFQFIVTS